MCPRSGEETGHLLHSTAKDQKGGLRILGSRRILSHLDTRVFKPKQPTLQGHKRLWKGPSKLGTKPRKGLPGDKETVNQHPCTRATRCNTTIQSFHLGDTALRGPHPKGGPMAVAGGLPVKVPGPSGLRVASMSSGLGCHGNPNQGN
jgi:hypothetical protein